MSKPILIAKNIYKSFGGIKALKGVDLNINEGEIRCIAGENGCGKSTIVKIASGVYKADSGTIQINGHMYEELNPITSINEGIQVIYQDLSLFNHMSVAENIAFNKQIYEKKHYMNWKEVKKSVSKQLEQIGVDLDLDAPVGSLSIANRQLTAISRALMLNAKILFMDEPTTALTKTEVDRLLSIVVELKKKGLGIVFISHKLNEVFEVADQITILRDGIKVGDFATNELNEKSLSFYMTGREVEYPKYIRNVKENKQLLEVKELTKKDNYENINFTLNKGDILGITGLLGSGRTELALSLFGLNKPDEGKILIDKKEVVIKKPKNAVEHGIALLPEDRHTQGLFLNQSIKENVSSTILDSLKSSFGFINKSKNTKYATDVVYGMNVNTKNINLLSKNLSGGNQQKIVIGKWVVREPKIFILDSPTVGIDIGSKAEIYKKIHDYANQGMGVILISDEIEEILANANKLLVMYNGHIIKAYNEEEMQDSNIKTILINQINNPVNMEV